MAMARIAHDKLEDGSWKVYVESARNLSMIKILGVKYLSDAEIRPLFNDCDVTEFRNLASLFEIEVGADNLDRWIC